jgi:hypothetical protein
MELSGSFVNPKTGQILGADITVNGWWQLKPYTGRII